MFHKILRYLRRHLRYVFDETAKEIVGAITNVTTKESVVALTFDDGPNPEYTPRLLKILERHNAYATFFVVGESAQRHPKLIKLIADAGHAIGNHSWDHSSFPQLNRRQRKSQIQRCKQAMHPYGQKILRPPYGNLDIVSHVDIFLQGYDIILWNVVAHDWLDYDAQWLYEKVEKGIKPGNIVLFHDALFTIEDESYLDRNSTLEAVDLLLSNFTDFSFVTIPELLRRGKPEKKIWRQQGDVTWLENLKKA